MTRSIERRRPDQVDTQPTEQPEQTAAGGHVELWVRGNSPYCVRDVQEETYARIRRLRESGVIDSFAIELWDTVETSPRTIGTDRAATCREKVAEFQEWAAERDYTLHPGFQIRETSSMLTDDVRRELVSPLLCLAVYEGDALEAVFPHTDGEHIRTVVDGLEWLEADADTDAGGVLAGGETA